MNTQKKTQHTPGPWQAEDSVNGKKLITSAHHIIAETCAATTAPSYAVQVFNARLVAAAPELLEALTTIIKRGYRIDASDHATAADAIAKATGTPCSASFPPLPATA
jgi:hypothetical protein